MYGYIAYDLALERQKTLLEAAGRPGETRASATKARKLAKTIAGIRLGASSIAWNFDRTGYHTHAAPFARA